MSKVHQLVRIEHDNGWGMFNAFRCAESNGIENPPSLQDLLPEVDRRHQNGFNGPFDDGIEWTSDYFFGYHSIEQLRDWVKPEEFKVLFENNFKVYLIEVSECNRGRDNTAFKKEHIILKKDISDLFK